MRSVRPWLASLVLGVCFSSGTAGAASPEGNIYRVFVFTSLGGNFSDVIRFLPLNTLQVDGLGIGPWNSSDFLFFDTLIGAAKDGANSGVDFEGVMFFNNSFWISATGAAQDGTATYHVFGFRLRNPPVNEGLNSAWFTAPPSRTRAARATR